MTQPLGVALIGVGMVSGTYADALSKMTDQVRLTGAMGRSVDSGQAFLQTHGFDGRAYVDVADIAADPDVDFAIITTPPNARADLVAALAAAGKPILMEKPVERTAAAAMALCEICERAGVPLGIVLQHRARPSALALSKRISTGDFGPLRAAEISVPWWRPQAYYDEPGRGTYARDGGGVMISQAIHTFDLALQFTGPVDHVAALTATTGFHRMDSEDFVVAGLKFLSGAVGQFFGSTASYPGRTEEIILHFERVTARLQSNLLELHWQSDKTETIGETAASGAGADPMAFTSDWHRAVIEDFADCVRSGGTPLIPGRDALPVHHLIEAIEASGRSGTRINLA